MTNLNTIFTEITDSLIEKIKDNSLTNRDLDNYFSVAKRQLPMLENVTSFIDYKNAGSLFVVMLNSKDYFNKEDERKTIGAIGYFIIAYYINKNILLEFGVPRAEKILEYIELLKTRLLLLLYGKDIFPELLMPISKKSTVPMLDIFSGSGSNRFHDFQDMAMSDAGEINKYGKAPLYAPLCGETVAFASSFIEDNSHRLANFTIEQKITEGQKIHQQLFNHFSQIVIQRGIIEYNNED